MRTYRVTEHTYNLIREQARPGYSFLSTAVRSSSGDWDMPVDDQVAERIEEHRLPGETDDQVVSRIVRESTGRRTN